MKEKHEIIIKNIIADMQCPKNFRCIEKEFKDICKAEDIGLDQHVVCKEKNASICIFSIHVKFKSYVCKCPLRVYIAKNLKK